MAQPLTATPNTSLAALFRGIATARPTHFLLIHIAGESTDEKRRALHEKVDNVEFSLLLNGDPEPLRLTWHHAGGELYYTKSRYAEAYVQHITHAMLKNVGFPVQFFVAKNLSFRSNIETGEEEAIVSSWKHNK